MKPKTKTKTAKEIRFKCPQCFGRRWTVVIRLFDPKEANNGVWLVCRKCGEEVKP